MSILFPPIIVSFNCLVNLFGFMTSKVTTHFSFYMTFQNLITLQSDSEPTKQGRHFTQINGEVNTGINILRAQKPNPNLTGVWGTHVAA